MDKNEKLKKAIEEQRELFGFVYESNRILKDKAMTILQANSAIIGLVAAGSLINPQQSGNFDEGIWFIVIIYVIVAFLTLYVWRPDKKHMPNRAIWEDIFEKHINVDDETDLTQTLSNYVRAIQKHEEKNKEYSELVLFSTILFAAQILVIGIALVI